MKKKCKSPTRVKRAQLQTLRRYVETRDERREKYHKLFRQNNGGQRQWRKMQDVATMQIVTTMKKEGNLSQASLLE